MVCDRFADSTVAYQGHGQGADLDALDRLKAVAIGDTAPDLTIILDLPIEDGLARAAARADDKSRYERMDHEMHARVRQGFLTIAKREPKRCAVIDAVHSADAVHEAVWRLITARLGGVQGG